MLFKNATREINDFLPRILAHIDGIDVDMVKSYIMDSIIQFIRDTKLTTEIICITPDSCIDSYKLRTTDRIMEVMAVRFFNSYEEVSGHDKSYYIEDDVFYIDNINSCTDLAKIEIEVLTSPYRDSDRVKEVIYEEWVDAITALTLSKLYLLTDNSWYNPAAASNQVGLYNQLVRQARFSRITKHKPFNMRLSNLRRL